MPFGRASSSHQWLWYPKVRPYSRACSAAVFIRSAMRAMPSIDSQSSVRCAGSMIVFTPSATAASNAGDGSGRPSTPACADGAERPVAASAAA